jgi:2-C-methyl-D-erythritol 2,4-cyclodiphosphate synthase
VGSHFPPSDDTWKGADSIRLLRHASEVISQVGWYVVNVDATVVCETPKIGPHREQMAALLAKAIGVESTCISIKGKTNEGMGWIGAREGLAVHAVALVRR